MNTERNLSYTYIYIYTCLLIYCAFIRLFVYITTLDRFLLCISTYLYCRLFMSLTFRIWHGSFGITLNGDTQSHLERERDLESHEILGERWFFDVVWVCFLSLSEFVYQRAFGAIPTRLPETFVISRAQAMDVLCDRDESPWFRVLSGMVFLINAGYRDWFFLSLMDLHLGEK